MKIRFGLHVTDKESTVSEREKKVDHLPVIIRAKIMTAHCCGKAVLFLAVFLCLRVCVCL